MFRHRSRRTPTPASHDRRSARHGPRALLAAALTATFLVSALLATVGLAAVAPSPAAPSPAAPPTASSVAGAPADSAALADSTLRGQARPALVDADRASADLVGHDVVASGIVASGIVARRVGPDDLARIGGGFCTTCSDGGGGGGGGGGTGTSGSPTTTGSPYWETYRVSLTSSSTTPSSLVNKINNYSGLTINGTFQYTRKVVRDVQFSGGYANVVRASIGGEVSQSTQTSVTYPIAPHTYGKLYVRYRTERRTYYGHEYQDFSDGTRTVVGSQSGPFLSTSTILGYVTGAL